MFRCNCSAAMLGVTKGRRDAVEIAQFPGSLSFALNLSPARSTALYLTSDAGQSRELPGHAVRQSSIPPGHTALALALLFTPIAKKPFIPTQNLQQSVQHSTVGDNGRRRCGC